MASPKTAYSADNPSDSRGFRQTPAKRGVQSASRLEILPLRKAATLSILAHALGPPVLAILLFVLLVLLSWLFHFNWQDWFKPEEKPQDLVFSLVSDTKAPPPEKPLFKGAHNQRAGGPEAKNPVPDETYQTAPSVSQAKPQAAPTKPVPKPEAPKPSTQPKPVEKTVTDPKPPVPPAIALKSEVTATAQPATETAGAMASNQTSANTLSGTGQTGHLAASGMAGGASQGGPSAQPGVDVIEEPDFGPFMADLKRRIQRNWQPPRGKESQRVKVIFYLARDGKLLKYEVNGSSGDTQADHAAAAAIELSAPFLPFPPQVREDVLPIEFTFDYNVLKPSNKKN